MDTIQKVLFGMEHEFLKNYVPPKDQDKLTEVEGLLQEVDFFSSEAFKLGLRLGAEVFGENKR